MIQVIREIKIPPRMPADPLVIEVKLNYQMLPQAKAIQVVLKDSYNNLPPIILEHRLGS